MSKRNLNDVEFQTSTEESTAKDKFIEDGQEYDPYAMSKSHKLPVWLKACFTKWWVAGMVFYFIYFGLSYNGLLEGWIFAVVLGVVWGCVTDVFVNHAFRGFTAPGLNYTNYIFMGRKRAYVTLPVNIIYGAGLSYIAGVEVIHTAFSLISYNTGADYNDLMFFLAPFLYAFLMLGLDMAFIGIRNAIEKLISKRKIKNTDTD